MNINIDDRHIITSTQALAQDLKHLYAVMQAKQGKKAWATPIVMPLSAWLREQWDKMLSRTDSGEDRIAITPEQETALWEQIISNDDIPLLQPYQTALTARKAFSLLLEWGIDLDPAYYEPEAADAFPRWVERFRNELDGESLIATAQMAEEVSHHIEAGTLEFEHSIIFYGFDPVSPAVKSLADAIASSGTSVEFHSPARNADSVAVLVKYDNEAQEAEAAARWVREKLTQQPDASIGILTPSLDQYRPAIRSALRAMMTPPAQNPGEQSRRAPWNVMASLPLATFPVVRTALNILELLKGYAGIDVVRSLLMSPYVHGYMEESGRRAMLFNQLVSNGEGRVSVGYLTRLAQDKGKPWECPVLAGLLTALQSETEALKGTSDFSRWAQRFSRVLGKFGWAKGRPLTGDEYQTVEEMKELFAALSGLEMVQGKVGLYTAINTLRKLASNHMFRPPEELAPIRVMDVDQGAGCQFDYLWVMGMTSQSWPPAPRPNPFIPVVLQREAGVPLANRENALSLYRALTDRLKGGSDKVVFSYPAQVDGFDAQPSRMLLGVPELDPSRLGIHDGDTWAQEVHQAASLEELHEEKDRVPAIDNPHVKGGSAIIKNQSNCPFRAFATHRLHAQPIGKVVPGLNEIERGNLIHKTMEKFWKQTKTHEALVAMGEQGWQQHLSSLLMSELEALREVRSSTLSDKFIEIEHDRLLGLLLAWLRLETKREAFEVVGTETRTKVQLGGLEFDLVIDRTDRLANGKLAQIDYKSGMVTPAKWFGDRPEDPQLPLYSTTTDEPLDAIAFGRIRAGDIAFSGVVHRKGIMPGLPGRNSKYHKIALEDWAGTLARWKEALESIATEYKEGRADVDPTSTATCDNTYCELQALCRIQEKRRAMERKNG